MPLLPGSIGETFVMLMAKCITSFSLGEALEMAWKVIFKPFLGSEKVRKNFTLFPWESILQARDLSRKMRRKILV